MEFGWEVVLGILGVVGIVLEWTRRLHGRISSNDRDLSKYMVKVAETYVTKEDLAKRLDRIEEKLDNIIKSNGFKNKS